MATFADPLVECKECHGRFRADKLVDGATESITTEEFLKAKVKCPTCGKFNWDEIKKFNMMFQTHVGPVMDDASIAYLRPETAQGIFTNYKSVIDTIYPNMPFGIAQQGRRSGTRFRRAISSCATASVARWRLSILCTRTVGKKSSRRCAKEQHEFLEEVIGLPAEMIHELDVPAEDRAHYSKRTIDMMFDYPNGEEELMGLAYRTDFDLSNIQNASGKSMEYRDKVTGETFIPHVIEPSIGVERLFLAILTAAYQEEDDRVVLKLPENLAPYKFCVSPLLKNKPELVQKAEEVYKEALKEKYIFVTWDDSGNIGKRYKKQDEIGTPKCVVIDFDTLEDGTVTVRDRDTTEQKRVKIEEL